MPVERPTFHESWYRVTDLHPKLRSTVQVTRQHFRGMPWHVVQDHSNNAFFRLAEPAYRFIALLDGKRSVGRAWDLANEQLGDDAPTQGEAIQLLGQLYTSNLLQAEVPADTHTLFARYKKRKQREIAGYMMNIMFARLPIFDPDHFLNKWLPLLGWIFSPLGLVVWLALIIPGIFSIAQVPDWQHKIASPVSGMLAPENLILLYVAFALIKACHEMGHAISCKKFGKQAGTGGEVHIIGIMFLVFTPVPYVDASSSWALTNKWHRAIVGAAGMWVELAIASVAAMVWANTHEGAVQSFAYNVMFVAGFSTLVFNANPLLRYDGYYILSDLLEIPNLGQRGRDYVYYLIKRYAWNVKQARNPAYSGAEKFWLFVYAVASFIMRIFVTLSIMFYLTGVLNGTLIILAAGMTIAGLITWALVPLGKFIHYLWTSQELSRVRGRAIATSAIFIGTLAVLFGGIRFPDRARAEGVVEPDSSDIKEVFVGVDGLVTDMNLQPHSPQGIDARAASLNMPYTFAGDTLLQLENPDLQLRQLGEMEAARQQMLIGLRSALDVNPAMSTAIKTQIADLEDLMRQKQAQIDQLTVKSPLSGVLITREMDGKRFGYVKRSDRIGLVANLNHLTIRAVVTNDLSTTIDRQGIRRVEIRVEGRPDILLTGLIAEKPKAGKYDLPSKALGFQAGGGINTAPDDQNGTKATEHFFEYIIGGIQVKAPEDIRKDYENSTNLPLLPGQRVVVRFEMPPRPLAMQAWTKLRQVFQKKFQM